MAQMGIDLLGLTKTPIEGMEYAADTTNARGVREKKWSA